MNTLDAQYEQQFLFATGITLPEKIEKSLYVLRMYEAEALKRDPDGYWLCDSFGKDSCVILHLAKAAGVKFKAHHNLTTLDPPELIRFGKEHHPDTVIHRPRIGMFSMVANEKTTLPTRRGRWCCDEYKEANGGGAVKIFGVRAAESARRAKHWRQFSYHERSKSHALNPILFWIDADVWTYIRDNEIPYCSLYDEGWTRLGCVGCPMNPEARARDFARWPGFERCWKQAITKFWNRMRGKLNRLGQPYYWEKFETPEALWQWWMEELPEPSGDDCQMGLF